MSTTTLPSGKSTLRGCNLHSGSATPMEETPGYMGGQGGQPVQDGEDLGDLRSLSNRHCYLIRGNCVAYMKPNLPQLNPIWGI
jgi:hypothetical protein